MALPQLLLVDDSEAILAYERASLGDRYALTVAKDGVEALERLRSGGAPDLIVLDLSMPRMDGEEVLENLRADPLLREIPVLLVSTESKRARDLAQRKLVAGFLPKPIEAPSLRATVERLLEDDRWRRSRAGLTVLRVLVGPHLLAFPLTSVRSVIAQPLATTLAGGPAYLREIVDVQGEPVAVLDLARRLGVEARARYVDRSLVIVQAEHGGLRIAIAVDTVLDPEVVPAEHVLAADHLGGAAHPPLHDLLVAVVRTATTSASTALVPVLRADAFLSPGALKELADTIASAGSLAVAAMASDPADARDLSRVSGKT